MRILLILIAVVFSVSLQAQIGLPLSYADYHQNAAFAASNRLKDSAISNKKWFVSTYSGLSTSFIFSKGMGASVFSVPLGIQLNRKLNNNFYAFAGASVAPSYINFNHSFLSFDANKAAPPGSMMYKTNNFGMYSRAEIGLMYVNDEKTFSISGSIGVERSSYPFAPQYQQRAVRPSNSNRATAY